MNTSYRKNAITAGILLILGFLGVPCGSLLNPILKSPDYFASVFVNETSFLSGIFFLILMSFACAGIAISLYPVLKRHSQGLALGAVGFRIIEAVIFLVGAACLLALVPISREYAAVGGFQAMSFKSTGTALLSIYDWSMNVLGLMAWNIGALLYYIVFFKSKLIPRWLSGWGIVGVTVSLISCVLYLYGVIQPSSDIQTAMNIPIGLQELVLAVWLIAKGFNRAVLAAATPAAGNVK